MEANQPGDNVKLTSLHKYVQTMNTFVSVAILKNFICGYSNLQYLANVSC